jgi:hypothetical protein
LGRVGYKIREGKMVRSGKVGEKGLLSISGQIKGRLTRFSGEEC